MPADRHHRYTVALSPQTNRGLQSKYMQTQRCIHCSTCTCRHLPPQTPAAYQAGLRSAVVGGPQEVEAQVPPGTHKVAVARLHSREEGEELRQ